ncbi:MAG: phosphate acyltransferase [Chloroflexota bacterium]
MALPDGTDERVLTAASWLADQTPVTPVVVASKDPQRAADHISVPLAPGVETVTPQSLLAEGASASVLARGFAGRPAAELKETEHESLYAAVAALAAGRVHAVVGGTSTPTASVIRAGLRLLGLAPATHTVTSSFLLVLPAGQVLGFGDCAVVPEPDPEQLAEIAVATSSTYQMLTGARPIVAMLSFSTKGSAEHARVDQVRRATGLIREREPSLLVDGELQFDAAYARDVGMRKAAGSPVAGRANVFIFPDLDAANIGCKIAERLGQAVALGPILQGLAAPLNDLSRGCSARDVAVMALVSAVQAVPRASVAFLDEARGATVTDQ